jgi:lipid-binding SYLF domain-containing protein
LDRVQAAQKVLKEIVETPDKGIPQDLMSSAKCVAVVPSMVNGGFIIGARYGKGLATCRTTDDHWSAPSPVRITGGSVGFQAGAEAVDLVMLVMDQNGMDHLLASKFKVGAGISGAAGPVGREASASTDWKMRAEVLTYSRARGVFGGVDLNGAQIKQDTDDTLALYGKYIKFNNILSGKVAPPHGTEPFLKEVATDFHKAQEQKAANAEEKAKKAEKKADESEAASNTAATQSNSATQQNMTTEPTPAQTKAQAEPAPAQTKAQVESALRDTKGLTPDNVQVDVTGDAVILKGSVPSQQDKDAALHAAEQNSGGRIVEDDQLTVK